MLGWLLIKSFISCFTVEQHQISISISAALETSEVTERTEHTFFSENGDEVEVEFENGKKLIKLEWTVIQTGTIFVFYRTKLRKITSFDCSVIRLQNERFFLL